MRRSPLQWLRNKSHLCPWHDHLEVCYFSLSAEKCFQRWKENLIPLHSLEISSLYLHSVFKVNFLPWYIFQFTAMLLATSEDCKQKSLKRLAQDDDNVMTSARNSSFNKRAIFSTQRSHKPDNLKVICRLSWCKNCINICTCTSWFPPILHYTSYLSHWTLQAKALSLNVFQEYNIGAITVLAFEHAVLSLLQFCATYPSNHQVSQAKALESEDCFPWVCRHDSRQ